MPEQRFVAKWVNGIWTIFDRVKFTNCEPDLGTEKNALRVLNAPAPTLRRESKGQQRQG
jgi:hypothetical protein